MDPLDVFSRPAEGPDAVLRYAPHADGLIDVFLPPALGRPSTPRPLLVLVHGGFWRQEWDRTHLRPLANAFAQRGLVVAVPEYRRTGGAGGWPMTGDDVRLAVEASPGLVDGVAPGWIDPSAPIVVAGHSAGGHLALWAGLRAGPEKVSRVVALAPVADVAHAARADLDDGAAQALLGGGPDELSAAYADADPFGAAIPSDTDVVVIHGTEDRQVPVEMSRQLVAAHPSVTYAELAGVDHFALIDPLSDAFADVVLPAVEGR